MNIGKLLLSLFNFKDYNIFNIACSIREAVMREKCIFLTLFKRGGGGGVKPMFKNYVVNFV